MSTLLAAMYTLIESTGLGFMLRDEGAWDLRHPFSSKNYHAHHWKAKRGR